MRDDNKRGNTGSGRSGADGPNCNGDYYSDDRTDCHNNTSTCDRFGTDCRHYYRTYNSFYDDDINRNNNTMNNIKIKIFAAIIVTVLAVSAVYYFVKNRPAQVLLKGQEIYKSDQFGFSFSYPKGFNVSDFADGGGKTILIKNAASDNGLQIFIVTFDEPGPITKERILKDIPDMAISSDEYISIGGEQAFSFISQDDLGGKTREIWFVHNGNLYRVKAYESFEKELLKILSSWQFAN